MIRLFVMLGFLSAQVLMLWMAETPAQTYGAISIGLGAVMFALCETVTEWFYKWAEPKAPPTEDEMDIQLAAALERLKRLEARAEALLSARHRGEGE